MKRLLTTVAVAFFASTSAMPGLSATLGNGPPFTAWVNGVIDGDSIMIQSSREDTAGPIRQVRLADIDCPEMDQAFGREAKLATETLLAQRQITITPKGKDKYGRMLADVTMLDGRSANEELVRLGACWAYPFSKNSDIQELQVRARNDRRGLWAGTDIEPPWGFRTRQGLAKISSTITGEQWLTLSRRDKFMYVQGYLDGTEDQGEHDRESRLNLFVDIADQVFSRANTDGRQALIGSLLRLQLDLEAQRDSGNNILPEPRNMSKSSIPLDPQVR